MSSLRLGVNVDHVATLRQARYATMPESKNAEPDLLVAARICERAGAGGIVADLRSDRRHIQDHDVERLRQNIMTKLNLEMGNTEEIVDVALRIKPEEVCLVPEKREEVTTEGGLDVIAQRKELEPTIRRLQAAGIRVSLFIDPTLEQVDAAAELGLRREWAQDKGRTLHYDLPDELRERAIELGVATPITWRELVSRRAGT